MTWRSGGGRLAVAAIGAFALVAGCAVEPASPLLREDVDRLRADVQAARQEVQGSRSAVLTEIQVSDRRTAQALDQLQRGISALESRLDDLGRRSTQIEARLDELGRRVDTLGLQFDTAAPPTPGPRARSGSAPAGPRPTPGPAAVQHPAPSAAGVSELYQTAYLDFTRGNYNLAIAAFQEFIRLHPGTELAQKAQFWIGESHFSLARLHQDRGERDRATQEFERAVQEFRKVVVTYPRGERVPTALYKEALALAELGQRPLAEARLQFLVDQFPSTEEAAKARDELGRLRKR